MKTKFLLSIIFLTFANIVFAQEDEFQEFKNQTENDFLEFAKKNQEVYDNFVEQNDIQFAEFLRNAWEKYEGKEPAKPKLGNKPEKKPVLKTKDRKQADDIVEREINIVRTPEVIPMAFGASLPPIQKKEEVLKNKSSISIEFFGIKSSFEVDQNLKNTMKTGDISSELVADFWEAASKCNHYDLINDLNYFKNEHQLNDWAYYQLVGMVAEKISKENKNQAKLLKWFLLIKSRYDARVGYNANTIYLMVASEYMIFGKNYFSFDNKNYFMLDNESIKSLRSYNGNYPDAKIKLNFKIDKSPLLGNDIRSRNLKFNYLADKYDFNVRYNHSNIDFYNTIPPLDLPVYFNAGNSTEFINSLVENLKPLVADLDEFTAVSYLLKFAQSAFDYKTDPQQFGYEKFFFAEETVFYPFSDCEDRSVFFATLVQEILNMEVVGLEYPGHVATAVKFSDDRRGDHLMYNGNKFIICDPTFLNAPVGMCMPQFINVEAKVIPLKSQNLISNLQHEIKGLIISAGGDFDNVQIDIDDNGNSFVISSFDKMLTFSNESIKPTDKQNVFFAKFDNKKQLEWIKQISATEGFESEFVKVSPEGDTYVAGLMNKSIRIEDRQFEGGTNGKQVFLVKYSKVGKFEWFQTFTIPQEANENFLIVAKFSSKGEKITSMLFEKNKAFNEYGISFSSKGDIILTKGL